MLVGADYKQGWDAGPRLRGPQAGCSFRLSDPHLVAKAKVDLGGPNVRAPACLPVSLCPLMQVRRSGGDCLPPLAFMRPPPHPPIIASPV